jgi:hypothetical protein
MRKRALSRGAEQEGDGRELSTYIESQPPPPEVTQARERVEARLTAGRPMRFDPEEDSAIHDLREYERVRRGADVSAVALRFELEHEGRVAAESKLKAYSDRLWLVITGVAVIVLAAACIWGVVTLVRTDPTLRTPSEVHS